MDKLCGPEEQQEEGGGGDPREKRGGVRFITEGLLLKLAGSQSLALVCSLNLSSAPGDKRIKFIERLHVCRRLQVLNLNHNVIERMERLNTLTQLRDLQMAHNHIQRIEGLEQLSNLQHLNLSYNRIQHVPVWLGKKLLSLISLQLQHNLITRLYEVSRLGSLSSLSELCVSGNPASSLPHARPFLLYHLRTLDRLDELPVTQEERGRAERRFDIEELQRLQQEVDSSQSELTWLQGEHQTAVVRLHQQEEANRTLMSQIQIQGDAHTLLEQELLTKSQLLKKTTAELTRAFHKLYELEQELAFYKIDAKLSTLPPCSTQDVIFESPYIGKARYIRNILTFISPASVKEGAQVHCDMELCHWDVCKTQQSPVEAESMQLAHGGKQPLEAEQFSATDTETHRQGLREEADEAEELEAPLLTLDSTDQQHAHVTTHLSSSRQLLDRMDRMGTKQSELDGRLDDMLSRIARETQEIKELEQQLTDGHILANEALQIDLEEIISGLHEYLRGLRDQAHCAQLQLYSVHAENQSLKAALQAAAEEGEKEMSKIRECRLQSTIDSLQDERSSLQQTVHSLQAQLDQTRTHLDQTRIQLDQLMTGLLDPEELQSGPEDNSPDLSRSVEQIYKVIQKTRASREQLEQDHNYSQEHIATLWAQLGHNQGHKAQSLESDWRLKEELGRLEAKCFQQNLESQLEQSRLQLQHVQQQRDELLQQADRHQRSFGRLSRKLQQLSRSVCDSDQLTTQQLNLAVEQLRALTRTLELLHSQMDELSCSPRQLEHTHIHQDQYTAEELRTQLADAHRLIYRLRQQLDRVRTRNRASASIDTKEGGQRCLAHSLGFQGTQDSGLGLQYLGSPDRGRYWVYIPPTHTDSDTAGAAACSEADSGSTPGDPAQPSDTRSPLVGPSWLLCGSPVAVVCRPPVRVAALHCNIHQQRDTGEKCVCVDREAAKLEEEKKKRLHCSLRRHRSVRLLCDEVQCVESTLLKRRAELRQADRLLLEVQSCIHTAKDQATSVQCAAQDSTTFLQEATQQLRELQEDVGDVRRRRQQEQQTLKEVQVVLRSRDQEFQQLGSKIQLAASRLTGLLSDCQEAQKRLDSVSAQVEQEEQRLVYRTQEHDSALNRARELRDEKKRLQSTVKELRQQQEQLLHERSSSVREEEQKLLTLQSEVSTRRAELKHLLQKLLVEQQALKDVKTKRTQALQQLHKTKAELDTTTDELDTAMKRLRRKLEEMDRMRVQLDWVQEEVDKRKDELEQKEREANGKMDELDQTQDNVMKKREELTVLQQKAESCVTSLKQQRAELQDKWWEVELQAEELRRHEDERKARLRCRLWNQQENLTLRRPEAEHSLQGLKVRLDKLDPLVICSTAPS